MILIKSAETIAETTTGRSKACPPAGRSGSAGRFASVLSSEAGGSPDFENAFQSIINGKRGLQEGKNPMKYGIVQSTLTNCDPKGEIATQVKDLTEDGARRIYAKLWERAGCQNLPSPLNTIHFDTFVQRPNTAMELLKKSNGDLNSYLHMKENNGPLTGSMKPAEGPSVAGMTSTDEFLRQSRGISTAPPESGMSACPVKPRGSTSNAGDFEAAVSFVMRQEGSRLVSNDNGAGRSRFGILQKTLRQIDPGGKIARDVSQLDERKAKVVYRKIWEQTGCDRLPSPLNVVHFDTMVHSPRTATRALETSDGNPQTYLETRLSALKGLKSYQKYGKNWASRIDDLSRLIR